MLKLVRYKILFVKRGYEHAFEEQEELVSDNMDASAYTAWKVAEFIQKMRRGEVDALGQLKNYDAKLSRMASLPGWTTMTRNTCGFSMRCWNDTRGRS